MSLAILLIEDNPDDAIAFERALKGSGSEITHLAVAEDMETGLAKLDRESYDIVFLDLSLPDARGLEALRAVLDKTVNMPVVVITGLEDDQKAIEAVGMGAQDYLVKGNVNPQMIFRVAHHAIERHRLLQEVKKERLAVQENEERFRMLFEANADGIIVLDADGRILSANPSAEALMGRSALELTGQPFGFPIHTNKTVELDILRPDGTSVVVEMRVISVKLKGENVFLASLRDITDRLQQEAARIEAEKRYRALFDRSVDLVFLQDLEGNFIDANQAALNLLGYDEKDISSHNFATLVKEDQLPMAFDTVADLLKTGWQKKPTEFDVKCKNGTYKTIETLGTVIYSNGIPSAIQGIGRDVTERNAMQRRQLLTSTVLDILNHPIGWPAKLKNIARTIRTYLNVESVGIRIKDGAHYPFVEAQGYPPHFIDMENDIRSCDCNRKIKGETKDTPLLECLCGCVISKGGDPDWDFVTAFGSFWFNDATTFQTDQIKLRKACIDAGYRSRILIPLKEGDKTIGLLQLNDVRPGVFDIKDVVCLENLTVNISITYSRVRSEQLLMKSKERYQSLFHQAPVMFLSVDGKNRIIQANNKVSQVFGYEPDELVGKNAFDFLTPESRQYAEEEVFPELLNQGKISNIYHQAAKKNGQIIDVKVSASTETDPLGNFKKALIAIEDVTEQVQMENCIRQSQKMEAIGTLAGGIAHDFNNILSAILGYTELSLDDVPQDSTLHENLQEVLTGGKRAAELVKQILTFSRQGEQKREMILIAPVVKEAIKLLRASLPATIEIRQSIADDLRPVLADPTQIHQIMMNLCTNAKHAMEDRGGTLSITLIQELCDNNPESSDKKIPPGTYLRLSVADTGEGISETDIHRIFDPYFSTKAKDKGTGLGLSVVLGIVENHDGQIFCDSEPGKGTRFDVFLPVAGMGAQEKVELASIEIFRGNERILIVDDEEPVAKSVCKLLESMGYQPSYQILSSDALDLFRSAPHQFDVVVSDMTMPHMTGDRLSKEIKKIRPDIPFILCTGFSETMSSQQAASIGIDAFLMKPLDKRTLAQTIRQVLDRK